MYSITKKWKIFQDIWMCWIHASKYGKYVCEEVIFCGFLLIPKGFIQIDEELAKLFDTRTITSVLSREDIRVLFFTWRRFTNEKSDNKHPLVFCFWIDLFYSNNTNFFIIIHIIFFVRTRYAFFYNLWFWNHKIPYEYPLRILSNIHRRQFQMYF